MARDKKRYYYPQPGIPRTQVLAHLQEEARSRGVPLSTHLVDLLVDRDHAIYGEDGHDIWFPRGSPVVSSSVRAASAAREPDIEANLAAFAGFMDDEDDMPTVPHMPAVEVPHGTHLQE